MATLLFRVVIVFSILAALVTGKRLSDLIFPKGTTFIVNVALGVFMPDDVAKDFAHVVELDFIYPVVEKAMGKSKPPPKTVWMNPLSHYQIKKWELEWYKGNNLIKDRQRRNLQGQLENAVNRFGFDGQKCVLRFQCELNKITKPESLLEDLLLIFFKRRNLDCTGSDHFCPFSLLQIILNSQYMNGTLF